MCNNSITRVFVIALFVRILVNKSSYIHTTEQYSAIKNDMEEVLLTY